MVFILSLWLPILLSAVGVLVFSSIIHMLLPYHCKDYGQLPKEDEVMEALRPFNIPRAIMCCPVPEAPRT